MRILPKTRRISSVLWILARHRVHAMGLRLFGDAQQAGPGRLRDFFEDLGGTFIKFGQVLSLQPDVLPRAYCDALFDLLDRVPAFPYTEVEKTFAEDLGRLPKEIFDEFEPRPIASASIGQVHVAWLDGKKLAVKVRRPSVAADFAADVLMLRALAGLIEMLKLRRWNWLVRAIREFCAWTHEELDYRYEARFMASLGYNARDNEHESVPEFFAAHSTSRILVAEFMEGPMVVDFIRALDQPDAELERELAQLNFEREEFARNIVRNFVADAFQNGLFHADLHPANLLILRDNKVGYVDFGITGSLSPYSRRHMVSLTLALSRAQLEPIMEHFLKISIIEDDTDIAAFRAGMRDLITQWFETQGGKRRLKTSFSIIMMDMLRLSRETNLWPTADVTRYIRSVITADGLIKRFAPDLDVNGNLEDICREYLESNIWNDWFSLTALADLTDESLRVLRQGPRALDTLFKPAPSPQERRTDHPRLARQRVLQYGIALLVFSLLAGREALTTDWGWNMFSVALAGALLTGIQLLRNLARLV